MLGHHVKFEGEFHNQAPGYACMVVLAWFLCDATLGNWLVTVLPEVEAPGQSI